MGYNLLEFKIPNGDYQEDCDAKGSKTWNGSQDHSIQSIGQALVFVCATSYQIYEDGDLEIQEINDCSCIQLKEIHQKNNGFEQELSKEYYGQYYRQSEV
ncbi:unnamed protein product [Paramecium octaurelia]|uniref:Uncharacterized protein n=1 Tax=Paramecium octaurelia TaxID=43137 RepID=A0A8S1WVM7_PAROT|nr:unnamed protein product [Paramecium octaurelia]